MSQNVQIRTSRNEDVAAIRDIYAHAVQFGTASFELEPPDITEMAARRQRLVDGGYPYLVAELDGTVVGYCYAGPYRPRPAYRFSVENSIYVAPDRHGNGIGRDLLNSLIAETERLGFRQMIAVIGDSGNAASITLHHRAGFRMLGTVEGVGFKFGRWIDSVMMQRQLGDGAATIPTPGH